MRATHLQRERERSTACGLVGKYFGTDVTAQVDCQKCRQTMKFFMAVTGMDYLEAHVYMGPRSVTTSLAAWANGRKRLDTALRKERTEPLIAKENASMTYDQLVKYIQIIHKHHNLGDATYNVRDRYANDPSYDGDSWGHPSVTEYAYAVEALTREGILN